MEMRCYRRILYISYKDHVINKEVRAKIQQTIEPHENLLTIVKRLKLQWYGRVSRSSGLAKTILQGTVKRGKKTRQTEEEVGRHQEMDRPEIRQVPEGSREQGKMEETGCEIRLRSFRSRHNHLSAKYAAFMLCPVPLISRPSLIGKWAWHF